jgi:hypothetical protein
MVLGIDIKELNGKMSIFIPQEILVPITPLKNINKLCIWFNILHKMMTMETKIYFLFMQTEVKTKSYRTIAHA